LIEFSKDIQIRAHNIVRELDRVYSALYEDLEDQKPPAASGAAAAATTGPSATGSPASPGGNKPGTPGGEKPKRKKEEGIEIKPKQAPFVLAVDDWGCDAHFGGDPFIKVSLALLLAEICLTDASPRRLFFIWQCLDLT